MPDRPPAEVGMALAEVDTPALIVDLDALERNLGRLADAVDGTGVALRPHAKTHKCAVLARRQVALGAVGVCCQKVGEAEALVHGGIGDVLVSNQVVGARKLTRLAALASEARIGVCVDHPDNVEAIGEAAARAGAPIEVLVEVDVGAARCGVAPGDAAVPLAARAAAHEWLTFGGLQAYHGSAQHLRTPAEREAAIGSACAAVEKTREALAAAGIDCPRVTGAGTGTWRNELASGTFSELQCGSYVFMDADYGRNLDDNGEPTTEFDHSLFVWVTVMSTPTEERAVVDAGLKALAVDSGLPTVHGLPGATYERAADEHGKLDVSRCNDRPALGDKIRLVPGHCDPTVNLYDWYVAVRGGVVEALWPIVARGALT